MALDKFGIEIQRGDILATVDTYRDYPPVLCVADGGFTNHFTRTSIIYIFGYELQFRRGERNKTKHLVVLNEEQVEGVILKIIQARLHYQNGRVNFIQLTEEEIREQIQPLLRLSEELKENNNG